ncbi:aminotransferase class I/II-fold pyridoxal phosphate-dependent enzyme [Nocardioidaceae bacterium]|nr:aminotransferase class I/II-fold pyridoxal phosphate-dependent enzyme [Nocardioidaceae bacterium]
MTSDPSPLPLAGTHGGDGLAVARALGLDPSELLDLSQNLNPFAPPAADVVRRHLDAVGRYPDDRDATALLADALGVDPARLLLTNGGSEAISLVAARIGGRVRSEPEFALHPRAAAGTSEGAGPVWRSNPHSPSGRLATADEHADVWDEAFHALATGHWSADRGATDDTRSVVVGSLTKTFACPGLRLGYVVARDADERAALAERQPHWSVGALALACLPDLLASADLPGWAGAVARARAELVAVLQAYDLVVEAADAPWVLVHRPGLRELLAPHGVLVRDCTSFGMPGWARVAVPDSAGLVRVTQALSRAVAPTPEGP